MSVVIGRNNLCRIGCAILCGVLFMLCTHAHARAQTNQIRFEVVGDFGDAGQPEQDVANLIAGLQPDFVVTTGDNNYPAGEAATIDANIGQFYHQFIYPYAGLYGAGASVNRFFPVAGNHDWGNAYPNPTGLQPYLDYFTLPGNERYYEFTWGTVHLFVLDSDPNEPDGMTSDSPQASWLHARLAASNARWKLVFFHHPPYSSGPHGSNVDMQWPFREWGASAVFSGHDHTYERLNVGGLPYFVNGLGGRSIYAFGPPLPESQMRYNDDYGAMLVTATVQALTFQFINRTGAVIDSYTLDAPPVISGQVLISEFRNHGPDPSDLNAFGFKDDFVELYNATDASITVTTTDGSAGWAVASADNTTLFVIPNGTVIPARAHYLAVNPAEYSLGAYATADLNFTPDLTQGIALFKTASAADFNLANRLDAAGFNADTGPLSSLCREGAPIPSETDGISTDDQFSYVRKMQGGTPQDTNDNASDFVRVCVCVYQTQAEPVVLGAPGPENLSSPIQRNAQIKAALVDASAISTAPPNRVRNLAPVTNGAQGTLIIRRKFTNKTGQSVTALRFRIVDITTTNSPNPSGGAQADLRALDSGDVTITVNGSPTLVKGTTVEQPVGLTEPQGGALNSSLVVSLPGGALAPNASVNVQFVLGVNGGGSFRFLVNVEAATTGGLAAKQRAGKHV